MRKTRPIIAGFVLCLLCSPTSAQDSTKATLESMLAEIDTALSYIKLTESDLALRTDYVDLDSFRLGIVDQVMLKPTDMAVLLDSVATRIFGSGKDEYCGSYSGCFNVIDRAFNRNGQDVFDNLFRGFLSDEECISAALTTLPHASTRLSEWLRTNPSGCQLLYSINAECAGLKGTPISIIADRNLENSSFLIDTLTQLLIEDPNAEFYPPAKIDSLQKVSEQIAERFTGLSHKVKWRERICYMMASGREQIFLAKRLAEGELDSNTHSRAIPQVSQRMELDSDMGRIALGGTGNDHYIGKYFFIFDPGGDDIYELDPCQAGESQIIYDLSGNDIYTAPEGYALGCGFFGLGFLYDHEGDDIYRAGNFSLGCGFFGAGILIDMAGNDIYISDTYSQGAGGFGYGFLYDHAGVDQYSSALYSQGFGFAAGVGLLADREGNDTYFAGGKYKDILRYEDHYLSLSQGFSYGVRPDFSGGVGWLLDGAGNDVYTADIFAQGCSYWWAFGGLYDGGGNDSYNCFQYGQGSATHMAAGILYDKSGSDVYFGKGLMQGCGHDRSTGWLLDLAGNDTYTAWDLSQGAGSANGTGMLTDGGGEDRYYVKGVSNTQGYGNPRRDFGSIGVFLDLAGPDRYDGNGHDDDIWIINSKWGVGVDKNSTSEPEEK